MKHMRSDYNERIQDSANLIPEDEPVFLLRAQDMWAPAAVDNWADLLALDGGDIATVKQAKECAKEMRKWQKKHGSKSPDM